VGVELLADVLALPPPPPQPIATISKKMAEMNRRKFLIRWKLRGIDSVVLG